MKRNLFYIIGVVCMMTSCVEEKFNQSGASKNGEVSFSANLNSAITRTLYDADDLANSSSQGNSSIKVNWVHNDLISVYGAQCTAVKQAEYRVGTVKVDDNNAPTLDESGAEIPVSGQNYANYLNKTGAAGVQWGSATTSDFYAIYPSTNNSFEMTDAGAKVKTSIRAQQTNVFEKTTRNGETIWVGTPYNNDQNTPSMPDALMYACTSEASSTAGYVDLNFKPWSTVLKFTFDGISYATGADMNTVTVSKIILTAPPKVDIVGDLELEINKSTKKATATPLGNIDNVVTIYPNHLPLTAGEKVEFCVYTIPQDNLYFGVSPETDLWKVTIETSHGTFTYKMRPSSGNANLVAGAIHNVSIPVKEVVKETDLPPGNWIEKIPRNVYLTELSVPGSWYSLDANYQSTTNLATQYAKGIRAFHIDCRLIPSSNESNNAYSRLVVAGTEKAWAIGSTLNGISDYGDLVADQVSTIISQVKDTEYAILVLNIAEKPLTANEIGSGQVIFGTIDPVKVLPAIYTMLQNAGAKIYGNETNEVIGANTLVQDVLGHLIVKINTNTSATYFSQSACGTGPALVSEASMLSNSEYKEQAYMSMGTFTSMQTSPVYWGAVATSPSIVSYYHQAQLTLATDDTSTIPSYDDRKSAIDDIIIQSEEIYSNNLHNGWYQIGVGGYIDTNGNSDGGEDRKAVTQNLVPYLKDWVNDKISGNTRTINSKSVKLTPSPIGVVLMNHCTDKTTYSFTNNAGQTDTASSAGLVDAIIRMNTKFYLNRDHTQPEWPTKSITTTSTKSQETFDGYAEVEPLN